MLQLGLNTVKWQLAAAALLCFIVLAGCTRTSRPGDEWAASTNVTEVARKPPAGPAKQDGGISVHAKNRPAKPPQQVASTAPPQFTPEQSLGALKTVSLEPTRQVKTKLVEFDNAPFPYDGPSPAGKPFLDVAEGDRKGHRTGRGSVLWEDETFSDRRVLLHIPKGFNIKRPGVAVLFFHGHGAKLERDVRDRQALPQQISASGMNAVLIAPQFAIDAADSSAGRFWEKGGCARFHQEAATQLAALHGNPATAKQFAAMPVVIVAYSGGYLPAAWCLQNGQLGAEVKGVILFDALYGELDKYESWIMRNRNSFFVSAYTPHIKRHNDELEGRLKEKGVEALNTLAGMHKRGDVVFIPVGSEVNHRNFMTHAWVQDPVKDVVARLEGIRR